MLNRQITRADQVELLPNTIAGLKLLTENGFGLVIVTNKSGIRRGYYILEHLASIHVRLKFLLECSGVILDGIYFCPKLQLMAVFVVNRAQAC